MPLCFAYGSNMDADAMSARCPSSRPVGPARLPGHRLVVMREGYLSVVGDPRREVRGLLWDVALADMAALDRYEDVGSGLYGKQQRSVLTEAGPRRALVYLGRNAGPGRPRPGYLEGVLAAAERLGLPAGYVREIEALAPAGQDAPPTPGRAPPAVRPTRASPLEAPRTAAAGWRWTP